MIEVREDAPLRPRDPKLRRTPIEGAAQRVRGFTDIPGQLLHRRGI
jgi:hypothetical protein